MKKIAFTLLIIGLLPRFLLAQHSDETANTKMLRSYEDSLILLGKKMVNDTEEMNRQTANYAFIKTLVNALKIPNSFLYPFDSVKAVSIINSPDNRFRIITWPLMFDDGSYRFYGTIQINTGGKLLMYPLNDVSPAMKNPEDTITDNRKWYGAEYYRIVPVYTPKLYYILLGWKGNNVKSTKKVIEVLSFADDKPVLGMPIFDGNGKTRKRVVFEYTRQASMLLRYIADQNLIVFDHLSPPDPKMKSQKDSYGPDLSYSGYKIKNGRWVYVDDLDMRNEPQNRDNDYVDPKRQAQIDKAAAGASNQ
ncbi:MAG TPA: hypothetical protein VFE53_23575 [Mucilaginibacter sp.]|jgi:hypothetical protein|nr:hypothetical protein [Mucilaginibacter sp.]